MLEKRLPCRKGLAPSGADRLWQVGAGALLSTIFLAPYPALSADAIGACAPGDIWTSRGVQRARGLATKQANVSRGEAPRPSLPAYSAGPWTPRYISTGLQDFKGKQRERVAAQGVVWSIDTRESGIPDDQALSALLRAGAASGWKGNKGTVFFRALKGSQDRIAQEAFRATGASGLASATAPATPDPVQAQLPPLQSASSLLQAAKTSRMNLDAAVIRLNMDSLASRAGLFGQLPSDATILPFGTGQIVRIDAKDIETFHRIVGKDYHILVPATSVPLTVGTEVGSAIGQCGYAALARLLPTPKVRNASGSMATLDIEGQSLLVQKGDLVAVITTEAQITKIVLVRLR